MKFLMKKIIWCYYYLYLYGYFTAYLHCSYLTLTLSIFLDCHDWYYIENDTSQYWAKSATLRGQQRRSFMG